MIFVKAEKACPALHCTRRIYDRLLEACETGVAAEIENVAMYDRLISATDQAGITWIAR